jgi:hypothetical protein
MKATFASQPKSVCWSDENAIDPRQIFKNADRKKYKFVCNVCFHKFEINLKCITMKNQFCLYCVY